MGREGAHQCGAVLIAPLLQCGFLGGKDFGTPGRALPSFCDKGDSAQFDGVPDTANRRAGGATQLEKAVWTARRDKMAPRERRGAQGTGHALTYSCVPARRGTPALVWRAYIAPYLSISASICAIASAVPRLQYATDGMTKFGTNKSNQGPSSEGVLPQTRRQQPTPQPSHRAHATPQKNSRDVADDALHMSDAVLELRERLRSKHRTRPWYASAHSTQRTRARSSARSGPRQPPDEYVMLGLRSPPTRRAVHRRAPCGARPRRLPASCTCPAGCPAQTASLLATASHRPRGTAAANAPRHQRRRTETSIGSSACSRFGLSDMNHKIGEKRSSKSLMQRRQGIKTLSWSRPSISTT